MNECLRLRLHVIPIPNQMLILKWPKLTTLPSAPSTPAVQPIIRQTLVSRMRRKRRFYIAFFLSFNFPPCIIALLHSCWPCFFGVDQVYPAKDFRIKAKWERLRRRCTQIKRRRRWSYSRYSSITFLLSL